MKRLLIGLLALGSISSFAGIKNRKTGEVLEGKCQTKECISIAIYKDDILFKVVNKEDMIDSYVSYHQETEIPTYQIQGRCYYSNNGYYDQIEQLKCYHPALLILPPVVALGLATVVIDGAISTAKLVTSKEAKKQRQGRRNLKNVSKVFEKDKNYTISNKKFTEVLKYLTERI